MCQSPVVREADGEDRRALGTQLSPIQFKDGLAGRPNAGHGRFPAGPRSACPHHFLRAPWRRGYTKLASQRRAILVRP